MGQKTNPKGFRASFIQQNFFFKIKRFLPYNVNINSFFFDFSLVTRKILFGEKTSQFFLIRQLLTYYASKLFCVLNEIRVKETPFSVFIFVEFFEMEEPLKLKHFLKSKHFLKILEPKISFATFFTFLQKHVENSLVVKKPVRIFYMCVNNFFSLTLEMSAYLKRKTGRLAAVYPVYILGFLCSIFPGAVAFSKVFARALQKNVKHSHVIETVSQLFAFLFQLKNSNFIGLRLQVTGRINGVDIAKKQVVGYGSVPLQTISSFINYNYTTANTPFGVCGIKIWFCYKKKLFF